MRKVMNSITKRYSAIDALVNYVQDLLDGLVEDLVKLDTLKEETKEQYEYDMSEIKVAEGRLRKTKNILEGMLK